MKLFNSNKLTDRRMVRTALNISVLIGLVLLAAGAGMYVRSATGYLVNANVGKRLINEHGTCNVVQNNGGSPMFIPTNTSGEWSNARTAVSNGVGSSQLGSCNLCNPGGSYQVNVWGNCTLIWESYDAWYTGDLNSRCGQACQDRGASACDGIGGGGGPFCQAYTGSNCELGWHPPLWGSFCGER